MDGRRLCFLAVTASAAAAAAVLYVLQRKARSCQTPDVHLPPVNSRTRRRCHVPPV